MELVRITKIDEHRNQTNQYERFPYYCVGETIHFDPEWYRLMPVRLIQCLPDPNEDARTSDGFRINLTKFETVCHPFDLNDRFNFRVYQEYYRCFDYQNWFHDEIPNGPQDVQMLEITPSMKEQLRETTMIRLMTDRKFQPDNFDTLIRQIDSKLKPDHPYMFRLSSGSVKHDLDLRPVNSATEMLDMLTQSRRLLKQEYEEDKQTYLILLPWLPITPRQEFRIFFREAKPVAVSQQIHSTNFHYTDEEIEKIQTAIADCRFMERVEPTTCVADVWIDWETARFHLIELNPWFCSGTSLFSYTHDHDVLYHGMSPQLRLYCPE